MAVKEGSLKISLKYEGTDVDDGTMPVEDVIVALQGFTGAYGKVANQLLPSSTHELRISAIDEGSFEVAILAWIGSGQAQRTIDAIKATAEGAKLVFKTIKGVIDAKKHIHSKNFEVNQSGDNNTLVIINADGASLPTDPKVVQLLKEKVLDGDLGKITSPLSSGSIDNARLAAKDNFETIETGIQSEEKPYFANTSTVETSQETEISGTLVSFNKETLRGTFKRVDGHKVPYRYSGGSSDAFYSGFSYGGLIRASCIAHFDENLILTRLEITKVVLMQPVLPFEGNAQEG